MLMKCVTCLLHTAACTPKIRRGWGVGGCVTMIPYLLGYAQAGRLKVRHSVTVQAAERCRV